MMYLTMSLLPDLTAWWRTVWPEESRTIRSLPARCSSWNYGIARLLGMSCLFQLQAPSPGIASPGCPAGCVDIQVLAGSFIQLSHAAKSLPSMSPRRGIRLLARSLPGFQPPLLEEGPRQELLQGNRGARLAGLPTARGARQPSRLPDQHPEPALAAHRSRQRERLPC